MLASKFLRNSCSLLSKNASLVKTSGESLRRCHTMAVPPRVRLSTGEKVAYLAIVTFSTGFIPFWILYHIPDYQNENRDEYTGK